MKQVSINSWLNQTNITQFIKFLTRVQAYMFENFNILPLKLDKQEIVQNKSN